MDTGERYRRFASVEAHGESDIYEDWAWAVATSRETIALIDGLAADKRQPNLVFAAARHAGAPVADGAQLLKWLRQHWSAVADVVASHSTQTNEARRCTALMPLLAALPQPLALLEVGAAAGLCLYPDRWSYSYDGREALHPVTGPGPAVLRCSTTGTPPLPERLPEVVWRAGIDMNPLDARNPDHAEWLRTLVWPGHTERLAVLDAALGLARAEPTLLRAGDLTEQLPAVAAQAPEDATLVVLHSAVLAYLPAPARAGFVRAVRELPAVWIANEAPAVFTSIGIAVPARDSVDAATFLVAQDDRPRAWAGPHGQSLSWLG